MIKCKKCNDEKPESAMKVRGGKPSKVCLECDKKAADDRATERARLAKVIEDAKVETAASRKHRKNGKASTRRAKKAEEDLALTVPGGGHGFRATITDEDALLITQDNPDADPDNIVLTKHEVVALFEKFGEWAVQS